jgi:environmental stress-induced protein Ves
MPRISLLRSTDYQRTRWKNDGGWTTEIARSAAADGGDFHWRVSIADIERDGPFSAFPGIERDLLLLEGNGIELDIDGADPLRLVRRFEQVHFAGESDVHCRLLAGPTRDFNVMTRRDALRAEVVARPLVGPMVIFPEADVEWLLHVHAGRISARGGDQRFEVAGGESLHLAFDADAGRVLLDGSGEILFAKFSPVVPA